MKLIFVILGMILIFIYLGFQRGFRKNCDTCGKPLTDDNKIRVEGHWVHKECPEKHFYERVKEIDRVL